MSTRWYPIYHVGNPQLRVYLPNFTMTLLKPFKGFSQPPNVVNFKVPPQMTQLDVKNYLEKIYKVSVINVKTINITGKVKKQFLDKKMEPLYKEPNWKLAVVTLPKPNEFTYPDLFSKIDSRNEEQKMMDDLKEVKLEFSKYSRGSGGTRRDVPPFFGI